MAPDTAGRPSGILPPGLNGKRIMVSTASLPTVRSAAWRPPHPIMCFPFTGGGASRLGTRKNDAVTRCCVANHVDASGKRGLPRRARTEAHGFAAGAVLNGIRR